MEKLYYKGFLFLLWRTICRDGYKDKFFRLMLCFRVLFNEQLNQGIKQGFATFSGIMDKF